VYKAELRILLIQRQPRRLPQGPAGVETANGCLVLHRAGTIAKRHERELKSPKSFVHALLQSASGEPLPS
jgi:hypothetical protein